MAPSRKFFVGGNWEMNWRKKCLGELICTLNAAKLPTDNEVISAPASTYIEFRLRQANARSQNCCGCTELLQSNQRSPRWGYQPWHRQRLRSHVGNTGAFGEKERRHVFRESDELMGQKVARPLQRDLA